VADNGRLPASDLAPIPGGELRKDAAAAWNAGPGKAGLRPTGPRSSYRTYDEQVYFWNLYQSGQGALAAYPGTSNHGWGVAVDLAEPWMREWIDTYGAAYGWKKTEAWSEWWHVNYVGGYEPKPTFKVLRLGSRGKRVVKLTRRLSFTRRSNAERYLRRWYWRFKRPVRRAVVRFQRDHGLKVDGIVGPRTWNAIERVFKRQYARRGK
jgi:hypothetical protein